MPFACQIVLQILDYPDPADAEEPFSLHRALLHLMQLYPIEDIRVCKLDPTLPPPPLTQPRPPAPGGAGILPASEIAGASPAAPKPPKPDGRRQTADGGKPAPKPRRKPAAPAAGKMFAPPTLTCPACGKLFSPRHTRGKLRKYCYDPACQRARWAAAQRAKNPSAKNAARLAFIKKRHARILAKKQPIESAEPPDDSDTARDEAEAARLLGATAEE